MGLGSQLPAEHEARPQAQGPQELGAGSHQGVWVTRVKDERGVWGWGAACST